MGSHSGRSNLVGLAKAALRWFTEDSSVIARAARFGLVGASSGLVFLLSVVVLVSFVGLEEKFSSVLAYFISMPMNFIANRNFSFRSGGGIWSEGARFLFVHALGIFITFSIMKVAVEYYRAPYILGAIGAIVIVPIGNFIVMNAWVFSRQARSRR